MNELKDEVVEVTTNDSPKKKNDFVLAYEIQIANDAVLFQVTDQADDITTYVKSQLNNSDSPVMTPNGYIFRIGARKEQWRFSEHTVYLRPFAGINKTGHIDITRFPHNGDVYIRRAVDQLSIAFKQFGEMVREWRAIHNNIISKTEKDFRSGKFTA